MTPFLQERCHWSRRVWRHMSTGNPQKRRLTSAQSMTLVVNRTGRLSVPPMLVSTSHSRLHPVLASQDGGFDALLDWKAVEESNFEVQGSEGSGQPTWGTVSFHRSAAQTVASPESVNFHAKKNRYAINFSLLELKSIRRSSPSLGWSYLLFVLKDGATLPALHFHEGGSKAMMKAMEKYVSITRSPHDNRLFVVTPNDTEALSRSFDELQLFGESSGDLVSKFFRDPYTTTLGGFSKVTNFLRDTLIAPNGHPTQRPPDEMADLLSEELPGLDIQPTENEFDLITRASLGPRPDVERRQPVSPDQWKNHQDGEGRITSIPLLLEAIFRGGIHPSLRKEVWPFLLEYYKWDSTHKDRLELRKRKEDDYFRMKLQWKSITEDQESRFTELRDRRSLIEKDVNRTDRTHPFFEGEQNPSLTLLYDILMTYCMYNFDLGYVQGMSDLLSPILMVMENEVDAFWCLVGFMDRVHHNFETDQQGMKTQLIQLQTLVHFLDPQMYTYLESKESANMYFCFRWLLIQFKREFSFPDIMRLWEVHWTDYLCQNFHLLLCMAILDTEKSAMMDNYLGFNEILKHINDLSLHIDVEDIMKKAEGIYIQIAECRDIPKPIRDILAIKSERDADNGTSTTESADSGGSARSADSSIEIVPDQEETTF
ncbi:TBC1 domain family member 15-like isoform X2 [Branchiostoma floridae]|uniref:TBC1 domain family member 15 n=1 Tax=Branchiostoma floridae TaxID=7739 RepID=A0A9J7HPS5_BRAFL|nr:TBC1 domain family member 15-like isoform X2 [Branchiostoma floridae]